MANRDFFELTDIPENINEFIHKLPLPVASINLKKEIVAYNRAFFLLAGREIRQGTHYCHEFLNFPFCHTNCLADMSTRMKKTVNWDESHGKRKNGEELIVRPIVFPMLDKDEKVHGHILLFLDTTDEVQLYQNFRANLDHLERKVSFLQNLNEAADQFRKITHVGELMQEVAQFAVEHLSVDCCQVVQEQESGSFVSLHTVSSPSYEVPEETSNFLLSSIYEDLQQEEQRTQYKVHKFELEMPKPLEHSESITLPIKRGSFDYGFLILHRFGKADTVSVEQLEYWELFAKSIGPYIENCHIITNLESIVAERTRALQTAQAQLMESTRLASVGEMAGMVAHEILNPMTAILARVRQIQKDEGALPLLQFIFEEWQKAYMEGNLEGLMESFKEVLDDGKTLLIEEDLENVREGVQSLKDDLRFLDEHLNRIVSIVDNLRGLSRSQTLNEAVDVGGIVEKTADLAYDELRKRQVALKLELHHKSKVVCDSNELIQVLHNLLRNAMQAIVKDGEILLSTTETEERLEIRVQDSGTGVPKEVAPKIFEMRFTTKSAHEGTGMGLNLSRRLMRQVHGELELEDMGGNGQGATFLCWLPKKNQKKE